MIQLLHRAAFWQGVAAGAVIYGTVMGLLAYGRFVWWVLTVAVGSLFERRKRT